VKILLTGGAGFIGAHTVEHVLATTDHELVVLDSLSYAGDIGRFTDMDSYDPSRVRVFWHDLRAPIPTQLYRRLGGVDWVINMAAESHVDRAISNPVPFIANNVAVATTMLEYARVALPSVFVQVSTDEVYGAAPAGYSHREWDVVLPSNPYAASKAAQEAIAISYWRTYGVPLIITNTMNNFGERQHPEKFLPLMVRNIQAGQGVPLHGAWDGHQWVGSSRVWLHARNHADALLWLAGQGATAYDGGDHSRPARFNVAGDADLAVDELARFAAKVLGRPLEIDWVDYHAERPGHDMRYSLDGSALRRAGWKPPVSFDESFTRTVEWMALHPEWMEV
jgi:dTDP-glucose 4,6-dehydratase